MAQQALKPFYVGFSIDGKAFVPAYGLDIKPEAIRVLSNTQLPAGGLKVRVMLGGRTFVVSAMKESERDTIRQDKTWWITGLTFTQIEDGDKDFIDRFLTGRLNEKPKGAKNGTPPPQTLREEHRHRLRKKKPYYIAFSLNGVVFIPGYGLDISRTGLRLLTEAQLPENDFQVRIMLQGNDFQVTVQKAWDRLAPNDEKQRWLTGARFTKIENKDREFLEYYVQDKPYFSSSNLLKALEELRKRPDNADLILPRETLRLFLDKLVKMGRLSPIKERVQPLVKYRYQGTRLRRGMQMHVLQISSKIVKKDTPMVFTTRFAFDDTASVIDIIE